MPALTSGSTVPSILPTEAVSKTARPSIDLSTSRFIGSSCVPLAAIDFSKMPPPILQCSSGSCPVVATKKKSTSDFKGTTMCQAGQSNKHELGPTRKLSIVINHYGSLRDGDCWSVSATFLMGTGYREPVVRIQCLTAISYLSSQRVFAGRNRFEKEPALAGIDNEHLANAECSRVSGCSITRAPAPSGRLGIVPSTDTDRTNSIRMSTLLIGSPGFA